MRSDKAQGSSGSRQKVVIGILLLVVVFILWQAKGMFSGGSSKSAAVAPSAVTVRTVQPGQLPTPASAMAAATAPMQTAQPMTPREVYLLQLQQQTEAKYVAAINELQMLRIEKDIAETNRAIAKAKLDTISAQKGILDMLTVHQVTQNLGGVPMGTTTTGGAPPPPLTQIAFPSAEVNYTVVSVSEIQRRWKAVISYQGSLYSVGIGDVIPADGSKITSIDSSGVTIQEKNGVKKKVSLVPII